MIDPVNAPPTYVLDMIRQAFAVAAKWPSNRPPAHSATSRDAVGEQLAFKQEYLPGGPLTEIPELDVARMAARLVEECPEIDIPDDMVDRIEVVWRRTAGSSRGKVVLGTCQPIGKRERLTWQGAGRAPWWRLTLALDVWCAMTPEERWRLVHHELMHATVAEKDGQIVGPAGRTHDTEEFSATIARYGLAFKEQARLIGQAMARPGMAAELEKVWGVDPASGQGLLFGADVKPVGWDE